ncbi:unnamed protein product [Nesidiocoris tenuis]|uniref:Uncharacterized protein n=1 Tax=Nesidiocoris tenuis TaxID=355587 RepID=A0A6H5GXB5_9HEMI|nr:unnamed protein product [Nesidiocoris tenuis]
MFLSGFPGSDGNSRTTGQENEGIFTRLGNWLRGISCSLHGPCDMPVPGDPPLAPFPQVPVVYHIPPQATYPPATTSAPVDRPPTMNPDAEPVPDVNIMDAETLDLCKENIQPLKQGRRASKLGLALRAQSDAELQAQLQEERERFQLSVGRRMMTGQLATEEKPVSSETAERQRKVLGRIKKGGAIRPSSGLPGTVSLSSDHLFQPGNKQKALSVYQVCLNSVRRSNLPRNANIWDLLGEETPMRLNHLRTPCKSSLASPLPTPPHSASTSSTTSYALITPAPKSRPMYPILESAQTNDEHTDVRPVPAYRAPPETPVVIHTDEDGVYAIPSTPAGHMSMLNRQLNGLSCEASTSKLKSEDTPSISRFSDEVLSSLFAVKQELCDAKFELKVNNVRFVGHPTLVPCEPLMLVNVVFSLQALASHSIVKCYYGLSKSLGIALRHEERRCGYLSEQDLPGSGVTKSEGSICEISTPSETLSLSGLDSDGGDSTGDEAGASGWETEDFLARVSSEERTTLINTPASPHQLKLLVRLIQQMLAQINE